MSNRFALITFLFIGQAMSFRAVVAEELTANALTANALTANALTAKALFPRDRVLDVQISVAQDDWDSLRHEARNFQNAFAPERQFVAPKSPYTYFNAAMSIDGVELGTVGIRKKGFLGSQSTTRPSLKIKLNHVNKDGAIDELTSLTLNNNQQDTTLMSQFLGYQLFNDAGTPAPRCAYAKVTVNGNNLGVYAHVETPRKPLLKRGFGTDQGTLFEGTVTDFFPGWEGSFEHETGDEEAGVARLKQLIAAFETVDTAGQNIVSSSADGRAIVPNGEEFDEHWVELDFDDSPWKKGQNGAGYETQRGFEKQLSEAFNFAGEPGKQPTSIYMRLPFDLDDVAQVRERGDLVLRVKFDDGFVAYLNGERVAAANAPDAPKWNSVATGPHDDNAALQFQSFDISKHKEKLREGKNVLAVHGLNISPESTDMLIVAELETNDIAGNQARELERLADVVDLDSFYRFWALEGLLGFWDGYTANRNNFFVYLHPTTNKFHFMPWGADSLFVKYGMLENNPRAPLSVKTQGRIAYTLYQTKSGRQGIAAAMSKLLKEHWHEEELLAEVDRIQKMVKPHTTNWQWLAFNSTGIRTFIKTRRAEITAELEGGLPDYPRAPGPPPVFQNRGRSEPEKPAPKE
jgi:spore coat protein CotH